MELFALLVAAAALVLSAEAFFAGRVGIPRLLRELYITGLPFLAAGVLLGSSGAVDAAVFRSLDPLVLLGLGSIGFLYGLHLEFRKLRIFPVRLYAFMAAESAFTFAATGATAWLMFPLIGVHGFERAAAAVVVGAASSGTSPGSIFHLGIEKRLRGPGFELARFSSALDDLPGLLAVGILFAFTASGVFPRSALDGALNLGLYLALGAGAGLLQVSIFSLKLDEHEAGLAVLGVIALASAVSSMLGICPLFTAMIAGATTANICIEKERVYEAISRREHSIYLLFLVLLGSRLSLDDAWVIALAGAVFAVRAAAKLAGWNIGIFALGRTFPRGLWLGGLGMLPQGGMAVGIAASYFVNGPPASSAVVTVLALCLALNGVLGSETGMRVFSAEEA